MVCKGLEQLDVPISPSDEKSSGDPYTAHTPEEVHSSPKTTSNAGGLTPHSSSDSTTPLFIEDCPKETGDEALIRDPHALIAASISINPNIPDETTKIVFGSPSSPGSYSLLASAKPSRFVPSEMPIFGASVSKDARAFGALPVPESGSVLGSYKAHAGENPKSAFRSFGAPSVSGFASLGAQASTTPHIRSSFGSGGLFGSRVVGTPTPTFDISRKAAITFENPKSVSKVLTILPIHFAHGY